MPKRQPRKRDVMRSFRIPVALDRQLGAAARKRGFGKSLMLREIVTSWLVYEGTPYPLHPRLPELEVDSDEG
jgi:hypothetical protein